jgi:catechol 2,3-dioxygenase-like lactoylglutathione lyase family enzyme
MAISGIDHAALPLEHVDAMVTFYRALGFRVESSAGGLVYAAHCGNQKLNMHTPALWQRASFTLRAPKAVPGSADLCFAWEGTPDEATALITSAGGVIEEGPVQREGGAGIGTSVYTRDPDGNLVELIAYGS